MRLLTVSLFALSLTIAACATEPTSDGPDKSVPEVNNYTPVFFASKQASEEERALCEGIGGRVERAGRLGGDRCIQDLPDAGDVCSDEKDCIGRCVIEDTDDSPQRGSEATGVCEATDNIFGCTTLVNGGMIEGTLCVD